MKNLTRNLALAFAFCVLVTCAACQTVSSSATPAAVSAAAATNTPAPPPHTAANSRQMAWDLGSSLSLATLGAARHAPANSVTEARREAEFLAQGAGLEVPPAPAPTSDETENSAAALQYLLPGPSAELPRQLAARYGADHAALYETAVKANILVLLYAPNAELNQAAAQGIEHAATEAKLPPQHWQPLLALVKANASEKTVSDAVTKMQEDVSDYLETGK